MFGAFHEKARDQEHGAGPTRAEREHYHAVRMANPAHGARVSAGAARRLHEVWAVELRALDPLPAH